MLSGKKGGRNGSSTTTSPVVTETATTLESGVTVATNSPLSFVGHRGSGNSNPASPLPPAAADDEDGWSQDMGDEDNDEELVIEISETTACTITEAFSKSKIRIDNKAVVVVLLSFIVVVVVVVVVDESTAQRSRASSHRGSLCILVVVAVVGVGVLVGVGVELLISSIANERGSIGAGG